MCRPNRDTRVHQKDRPGQEEVRRVSFGDVEVVGSVNPRSSITAKERCSRWYQKEDYQEFRASISRLSRVYQDNHYRRKLGLEQDDEEDDKGLSMRGLERRMSSKRQRLKDLAIRDILKTQDDGHSPRQVAVIARECSSWATDIAVKTGRNDYNSVYHPSLEENDSDLYLEMEASLRRRDDDSDDVDSSDEEITVSPVPYRKRRMLDDYNARYRSKRPCPSRTTSVTPPLVKRRRIPMWQPESWVTVP